jgi:hypothetical protein
MQSSFVACAAGFSFSRARLMPPSTGASTPISGVKHCLSPVLTTILKTCFFKIGNQGTKFSGHLIATPDEYQIAAPGFCLNRHASSGNGDPHPEKCSHYSLRVPPVLLSVAPA